MEHSDRVIAVYDGRETGGTAKTIRFTHRMKKELREIPVGEIVLPDHLDVYKRQGLCRPDTEEFTEENALLTAITGKDGSFSFENIPYCLLYTSNGLTKRKYITFGIEADDLRTAKMRLERIETDGLANFKTLGVPVSYTHLSAERLLHQPQRRGVFPERQGQQSKGDERDFQLSSEEWHLHP